MIHEQASRKITLLKKNNVWLNIFNKKRIVTNQSGRLNILEKVNYNIFLTLTGVWYKSFSQLSFRKFLWIHSGTLQGKLPPSLSPPLAPSLPTPCHQPQRPRPPRPQSLPFGVLWRERTLTTTPSVRDNIFIGDMPLLSTPAQTP